MRLSMWILKTWLEKYNPEAAIEDGDLGLRNVRLYADNHKPSDSTVFLNRISDHQVMCSNRHDILILEADDINEVFNDIMDAFDHYNDWEEKLRELIRHGCSAKELLNAAYEEIPRLIMLADATFYMREYSMEVEDHLADSPEIENLATERLMPLDIVMRINRDDRIRRKSSIPYCIPFPEYGSSAAIINLFIQNRHLGWLVTVLPQNQINQGELDLLNAFGRILTEWLERNPGFSSRMEQAGFFLELMEQEISEEELYPRLEEYGWQKNDPMDLYVICQETADPEKPEAGDRTEAETARDINLSVMERFIKNMDLPSFLFRYQDNLALVVNRRIAAAEENEASLISILEKCGTIAGKSSFTQDLGHLRYYYEAAKVAALHPPDPGKRIIPAREAMLPYILSLIKENSQIDLRHPALILLADYDRQHDTELYKTLYCFLENHASYTETARVLMIHRSTLIYRMNRITEMTDIDLSDPGICFYLMLSYYLDKETVFS